ncbi:cytochrome b-c1 complex subunit 7 [Cimex lectularius]|uniref:Cytochrome b-c1 complex subunit 7 n=1 Tax=Cimex lectularius TaxID=79782 RepID=A0A8I6RQ53_CIMLE|nr:cytochrome b-c1 complex subunit 7 [Cimex lectularius]
MAAKAAATKLPGWRETMRRWAFNLSGYNKYGLLYDDLLRESEDVQKALKRLPDDVLQKRNFRVVRAMQLELCHDLLPKEQWTKYEEDVRYLSPIVEQVRNEREEMENWEKEN